jgi:two-component system sensor histidine kinase SenX3
LAAARVGQVASRHGVELVLPAATEGVALVGDRTQLVSAIANLLDNAVKYSDPGSTVEIDVRAGRHSTDIAVRDRGVGIPARDLSRIFERFYRVDRARSRQTGGTGLGLAIVRHVATNHGGEVLVESREGEGSTFTLRLPSTGSTPAP